MGDAIRVKIVYGNSDLPTYDPSMEIFKTRAICLKERKQITSSSELVEDVSISLASRGCVPDGKLTENEACEMLYRE